MPTPSELRVYLAEAEAALHALMTGKQSVSVGYESKTVTYTKAEIGALRAYIAELKARLGQGGRRALGVVF